MSVHAAMEDEGISNYSRRERQSKSGGRFPAGVAGRRLAGTAATRTNGHGRVAD